MISKVVIFGAGDFISDVFDAALANGLSIAKVILNVREPSPPASVSLADRIASLERIGGGRPVVERLEAFVPAGDECYVLGITTPAKERLVRELAERFGIACRALVHPRASVSPLATLGAGVFVGAGAVIAPGAALADHVIVNRGATIGHDTWIDRHARVNPGATVCGLVRIGRAATIGAGSTVIERLRIGEGAFVSAGALVVDDVRPWTQVMGAPARFAKSLPPDDAAGADRRP